MYGLLGELALCCFLDLFLFSGSCYLWGDYFSGMFSLEFIIGIVDWIFGGFVGDVLAMVFSLRVMV